MCKKYYDFAGLRDWFYFALRKPIGDLGRNTLGSIQPLNFYRPHVGALLAHVSGPGARLERGIARPFVPICPYGLLR
jgi:hypothetical protein